MRGKNLTAKLHQSDAFTIYGFELRSTLAFKVYSAATAAIGSEVMNDRYVTAFGRWAAVSTPAYGGIGQKVARLRSTLRLPEVERTDSTEIIEPFVTVISQS